MKFKDLDFKKDIIQGIFISNHFTSELIKACEEALEYYTTYHSIDVDANDISWQIDASSRIYLILGGNMMGTDEPADFFIEFDSNGKILDARAQWG